MTWHDIHTYIHDMTWHDMTWHDMTLHTYINSITLHYITLQYITLHSHMHTHTHTYIHTYINTYIHTYIHTYLHTYIHTFIHTYIHTYIHIYIYKFIINVNIYMYIFLKISNSMIYICINDIHILCINILYTHNYKNICIYIYNVYICTWTSHIILVSKIGICPTCADAPVALLPGRRPHILGPRDPLKHWAQAAERHQSSWPKLRCIRCKSWMFNFLSNDES